jgi:hypothetical protein
MSIGTGLESGESLGYRYVLMRTLKIKSTSNTNSFVGKGRKSDKSRFKIRVREVEFIYLQAVRV